MRYEIVPLQPEYSRAAAEIFVHQYAKQRQAVPILPENFLDVERIDGMIAGLAPNAIAALQNGRLAGYMGWYIVNGFRNTSRRGAYCPEWGHAVADSSFPAAYQALYTAAAARWAQAGCEVHALTLLAHDQAAHHLWFWSGFGMTVVDAIRPMRPTEMTYPFQLQARKATPADAEHLAEIEAEHWLHYSRPPTLMAPKEPDGADAFRKLIEQPVNSVWLAEQEGKLAGYIRFERSTFGAAAIVQSDTTVAITGAYVRPAYRGKRAAVALLDAAMADYAGRGFTRCSVDFESINPDASSFWPRYFQPVCYSVTRIPEVPVPPLV